MVKYTRATQKKSSKKPLIIVVVLVVIAMSLIGAAFYAVKRRAHTTELPHRTTSDKGDVPVTPNTPTPGSPTPTAPTPTPEPKSNNPTDTAPLKDPTGTFVSNHHPALSGPAEQKTIQSVCLTTPGASCTITFTKGDVTKTLGSKTADRDGAAYWTWTLQEKGLTPGSWQVTATATLGSQTKQAKDALALEVGS